VGGAVAAIVVIALIVIFVFMGKKGPAPTPPPEPANEITNAPAPVPAPVEPTPPPPTPGAPPATEAEIAAARKTATDAARAFDKSIADLEALEAGKYAAQALDSLKQSQRNIQNALRRAKTPAEYNAAAQAATQASGQVDPIKRQIEQAKAAAAAPAPTPTPTPPPEPANELLPPPIQPPPAAEPAKVKAGDMVPLWQVDVKPKEIKKVQVQYTPMARANKVAGTVYVEVTIDETGRVTDARVVRGLNPDYGLNDACVKAAQQTTYTPAIKDGVPVKTLMTYPVIFKIG
jgi:TonB family protein